MHSSDNNYGFYFLGLCLAIGLVVIGLSIGQAIRDTRSQSVAVKGVAEREVKSDRAVWDLTVNVQSKTLPEAYAQLLADTAKVQAFLEKSGITADMIEMQPLFKNNIMQLSAEGRETSIVDSYRLTQTLRVQTADVALIAKLQQDANSLLAQNLDVASNPAQYFYTGLEAIKVGMLSEATKNAMQRASEMANNTGNRIGSIRNARQGVFQITNPASNDVSDYGYSDTSSIDKKIRAIVAIDFSIKN